MKALVLQEIQGPQGLRYTEVPDPHPGPGEVRVKILASALNHRDLWITFGKYAGVKVPQILGSDGVGIVDEVGEGVEASWREKTVIINPSLNWGEDPKAQGDRYEILGLPRPGTMAEYCVVPVENIVLKPPFLSVVEAAALPLAGLTAYRALVTRGGLEAGERLLITGIGGGVATMALQFAVAMGAEVWVTSSSEEKIRKARELGARGGYLYTQPGWAEKLRREMGGVDLILDGAGGEGFGELLFVLAPGGRLVIYGATRGNPSGLDLRRLFWRQLNIMGSTMGTKEEFEKMVRFVSRKKIRPVVDSVYPLEKGKEAFQELEEGKQMGKIVLSDHYPTRSQ